MIEQRHRTLLFPGQGELGSLQQRANSRRDRHKRMSQSFVGAGLAATPRLASSLRSLKHLPSRYLLHTVVAIMVPLALVLSQVLVVAPVSEVAPTSPRLSDAPIGLGPISLEGLPTEGGVRVGDPPLAETDALPVPLSLSSRSEVMAPLSVPATLAGDSVKLRTGPGLDYDEAQRLDGGTSMQVVGRHGDWFQVQQASGTEIFWVAGELLNMPENVIYTLLEVPQEQIPPPPPPKVGTVRDTGLRLRDGPGTNYVRMTSLDAGAELSLVEQYQDWLRVATDNFDGWVSTEFLDIAPGVLDRVPVTETIPDPNPALVGTVLENSVNMRKGPGTVYDAVDKIGAGNQVDLVAQHDDWFKVQIGGTNAWIFSELMDIAPMVQRRVPFTNDIPAAPAPIVTQSSTSSSNNAPAAAPATNHGASSRNSGGGNAFGVPASGDVAGFATQFVGHSYIYGGASPGGFDCSGLTSYVYRQFGVSLPHHAASQYSSAYGAIIGGIGSLAPGDLVFFANTGGGAGITHVAIYIGGGQVVHAMTPAYGVQISSLYENYWSSHFYGGLRVYR